MTTIRELVEELVGEGYKITPRTIKHYIGIDLLPKPEKQGGYKEGVKLIYQDGDKVKRRIKKIYELKGKGYTLSDIKDSLREREEQTAAEKRVKELEQYIEKDGRFYHVEDWYTNWPNAKIKIPPLDKLSSILALGEEIQQSFWRRGDIDEKFLASLQPLNPSDFDEMERRELIVPVEMDPSGLFHWEVLARWALYYVSLNKDDGIGWDTLEALHKQHIKNFDRFSNLPEPDSIRFTKNWIGWFRRCQLNKFGEYLNDFIYRMSVRFLSGRWRHTTAYWDANYSTLDEFITDFLEGKCAFFTVIEEDPGSHDGPIYRAVVKI